MKLITDKASNGLQSNEFNEFLLTRVPKTEFTAIEADELEQTLKDGLKNYPGLGISATQLGIKKRACYIKFGDEENGRELFLLNPVITERSKEGFLFYEGCLSIPKTIEKPLKTIRSCKIKVQTDNLGELEFEINPEGDKADDRVSMETMMTVIVQHEIDHLDGITIKDRIYSTTITKKNNYGRNDKIVMKSPTGELVEVKYKKANDYFLKGYEIV
jgi:peptide deformylase